MNNLDELISNVISAPICEPQNFENNIKNIINKNTFHNNKKIKLYRFIPAICALFLFSFIFYNFINKNNIINTKADTSLTIEKIISKIDKNKIISRETISNNNFMLLYNPSIENLYKNADIVLIGTFNSNLKITASSISINTQTKFNTIKLLKNKTQIDIKDTIVFNRPGGVISLAEYEKNGILTESEFKNIPLESHKDYYIVQEYAPNNKLDFNKQEDLDCEYLLFLNYWNNELVLNSGYYGMREIKNNKIYDYDSDSYIDYFL